MPAAAAASMIKYSLLGAFVGVIALPLWGLLSGQFTIAPGACGGLVGGLVGGAVWGLGARLGQRTSW